ncbi:MAG: ATP-dependent Clp protease ATP-binding subunit [Bacteroidetes bacterium]|nr:ATP-dependent Clp protease ATP-binding subunit [Bacteroidota bacterium]
MKKQIYPLLCYRLKEEAVLGMLIDSPYQLVEKDIATLKTKLSRHLQKQYKKGEEPHPAEIISPKLKLFKIGVRPTIKDSTGNYPMSALLHVSLPVVYGETDGGHFKCHLPLFNRSFYYYEKSQLKTLVTHTATNLLNQLSPAELNRFMIYSEPSLETVVLKVHDNEEYVWGDFNYEKRLKTLQKLSDKLPHSKKVNKVVSISPDTAWEMDHYISDLIDRLINKRANVLLVGNPGVGKSAVLQQAIKRTHARKHHIDYTFWRIMPQRITASSKYLGEWQEVCEQLVEELQTANGILWVENIIQLLQIGGEGVEDSVAAFLQSFVQQGKMQLVGEVTPQELESMRRLLPAFSENFQIIEIEEPEEKQILKVLQQFANFAEKQFRLKITDDALGATYRLLKRFSPYERFPGKGIRFLGQCINDAQHKDQTSIQSSDILNKLAEQSGLPELFFRDELYLPVKELEDYFVSRIIGQPEVVKKFCSLVKIFKAGLNNPHKPINTLLFAGPTGVGKTASAKALAEYFFSKGQKRSPLIRLDMSEFQHPGQIHRFIGIGKQVGQVAKEVRERPFSVLLLDEIEKAHPSIFDALLTVFDEGQLVDNFGRITNFRNSIIIMTSNLGASSQQSIGYQDTSSEETVFLSSINRFFRPEFLNRIDKIVYFKRLTKKDIYTIALKELNDLKTREGFTKRQLEILFLQPVVEYIAQAGFDRLYGARPLQRAIEQAVINPIARWLLLNPDVGKGKLTIDYQNGLKISFVEKNRGRG